MDTIELKKTIENCLPLTFDDLQMEDTEEGRQRLIAAVFNTVTQKTSISADNLQTVKTVITASLAEAFRCLTSCNQKRMMDMYEIALRNMAERIKTAIERVPTEAGYSELSLA